MEYLLEIRFDEVPSRLLRRAGKKLGIRLFEELMGRGLGPSEVVAGLTPRRLVYGCRGLPEHEADREERELGPAVGDAYGKGGRPTEALEGFAERLGVEISELSTVKTEKGEYVAFERRSDGRPTAEILAEVVPRLLSELTWGAPLPRFGGGAWIRPLRGIVSVLDGEVVPFTWGGVEAGAETVGHPILSPQRFAVDSFDDYRAKMEERGIEVSFEARRKAIASALQERAAELGGEAQTSSQLLDRLALRVEVPGVVASRFEAQYLSLPPDVLKATLVERQGVVPLVADGEVMPLFLAVTDRADDPQGKVAAGHAHAAAGKLADVRFHLEQDHRLPLAERARRLDGLVFHPRLGHTAAKVRRVISLVELIAGELGYDDDVAAARQAAELLKADLSTAVVRHLGSLRGRIGGIYAKDEGYVEAVWQAIYDQYLPASLNDPLPRGKAGLLVAVADRLDTLVGFFGIGELPTGSKDPHGLRRMAEGLLRLLIEAEMPLDVDLVAARAVLSYNVGERVLELGAEEVVTALRTFLADRLRLLFGRRGFAHDEIEAAMAVGTTPLPDLELRVRALATVREDEGFRSLVLTAKRIWNIVKDSPEHELEPQLLEEGAEKDLYAVLVDVRRGVAEAIEERDYEASLKRMAELVPALDRFFADVLVMDEDETRRGNRMALLQAVRRLFWRTARLKEMAISAEAPPEGPISLAASEPGGGEG